MLKWAFRLALLFMPAAAFAQTGTIQGYCDQGGVSAAVSGLPSTNKLQGNIPSCTITVYFTGTTTQVPGNQVFRDGSGTVLGNPFTADALGSLLPGHFLFWVALAQAYDVTGKGGIAPNVYPQTVPLLTDVFASSAGGGGGTGCNVSGSAGYLLLDNGSGGCVDANNANISVKAKDTSTQGIEFDEFGSGGFEVQSRYTGAGGLGITLLDLMAGITIQEQGTGGMILHAGSGGYTLSGGSDGFPGIVNGTGLELTSGGLTGTLDDMKISSQTNHIQIKSGTIANTGYAFLDTSNFLSGDTWHYTLPRESGTICTTGSGCGGGGSGPTLQTNGTNNTSQTALNFVNPSAFNGLTFTFSNPTAGNETFAVGGTLGNAGLTNPSMTINSTTCTLGGSCTVSTSGSGSVGTAGQLQMVGSTAGSFAASAATDNGTTFGISKPTTVNDGTGKAGNIAFLAGTAPSAALANTVQINAPTSVTAYAINLPGAQPTAGNTRLDCTPSNPAVCSWAAASGSTGFPINLGSTSIASGSTTTAVTGLSVNGVTLNAAGSASLFLNQVGGYTAPSGGSSVNGAQTMILPNDSTGTTAGYMSQWHDNGRVTYTIIKSPVTTPDGGSDLNVPLVGVCIANCGTSGKGTFQFQGNVSWVCDNQTFVGDWVTTAAITPGLAGECDDPGGGTSALVNENPELNSIVGVVVTANTGAHTASVINLMPFYGFGQIHSGMPFHGQAFMMSNYGSPFLTTSYWTQNPSTFSGSSGSAYALNGNAPIDLWNSTGFFELNPGLSGLGASGRDIVFDNLSHGFGIPPTGSIRVNASLYNVPTVATVTGTTGLAVTQTTGVYQWTLSGNTTLSAPTVDNAGHVITFDIIQAATGGPFTFTWNSVFKNPPTISTTASAHTVASFYFDGTNYNCIGGCSGIASATTTVGTSAIAANTCNTVTTVTMTGVATTTAFAFTPNADVSGTTGWGSTGGLTIDAWPTANTLNYKTCNQTNASITPGGSVTFNVSAR